MSKSRNVEKLCANARKIGG
ncbi:hypothetical protein F383_15561 [Gossypium arboreum]|uniref:Uncharacterized protein n=1 Tax=Gossypium arboreum TaxID=29729 RepID=A0A0B0NAT7_GOSAR|nr:hypothetical protein F383_15561 [Gossypium arboreum]